MYHLDIRRTEGTSRDSCSIQVKLMMAYSESGGRGPLILNVTTILWSALPPVCPEMVCTFSTKAKETYMAPATHARTRTHTQNRKTSRFSPVASVKRTSLFPRIPSRYITYIVTHLRYTTCKNGEVYLNSSVFWDVTWRRLVKNRRFGTTFLSHLHGPSVLKLDP